MRKLAGVLFAASLLTTVGVWSAGPAGAASGTTCKSVSLNETSTPGLPIVTSKAVVTATVKLTGKVTGCSGGGVTSASLTETYKYKGNCAMLAAGKGTVTPLKPTTTYTWNNHKTSTATSTTTVTKASGFTSATLKDVTHITSGLFKGTSATGTLTLTAPKGSCTTIPGAKLTLTGKAFTLK
jgi:hypothetical protein